MKKRLISTLLTIAMFASLLPTVFAANTVTRAEWISQLVEAFSMTVEDDSNMPDNYFSDITETDSYYRDILLAVEFGVIDLEAGEAFEPTEPATREFAARTLNSCLQFQLDEGAEYTYSEANSVTYPDDIQIAINRNWFALSGGNFLPEQAITSAEATAMLADAKAVIDSEVIDENHENSFEFADGVIVIPETAQTTIDENNTVTITDNETEINVGDIFVVFSSGYPVVLKAESVKITDNITTISATKEGTDDAVVSIESEGSTEIDLEDFQFNELTTYSITNTQTGQDEEMDIELYSIDFNEKSKTLTASQKISVGSAAAGTITVKLKNIDLKHKVSLTKGIAEAIITADTTVTTNVSFDFGDYAGIPSSLTLGGVPVMGIGMISLSMEYSLKGGVTMTWDGKLEAGFSYRNSDFRLVKNYKKTGFSFTAEAQIQAGLKLSASVDLIVANANIYGTIGVKMSFKLNSFDSGTPKMCVTIKGYLYAEIGAEASIFGQNIPIETQPIYTEYNSPVRVVYHYEDNVLVNSCTRGLDLRYTTSTHSGYFNPSPSYGQGSYGGGEGVEPVVIWEYTTDDGGNATITKYNGNASAVAIPSELDGHKVVKIGNGVFRYNKLLRSITIPNSITEIGERSFGNCNNLSSVHLSRNLITLGRQAFENCDSLTEIEIPKSLTTVTDYYGTQRGAFNNSGLKTVTFEEGTTRVAGSLFEDATNLENVYLLDSMTSINGYAFYGCKALKNMIIPDSVTEINTAAFANCTTLSNIELPNSINAIYDDAFSNCSSLSNVKLPKYLETIGHQAFENCDSLTEIEIPKSLTNVTDYYDTQRGVFNNSGLKTVTFENGTTKVANSLLEGATNLENVYLLDSMTTINRHAFDNCKSLKHIEIPNSVVEISASAFANCISLENITFSDSIVKIQEYAFSNCTKLNNVKLPKYLETIGYHSFEKCSSLTEIEIPKSLTTVTDYYGTQTGVFMSSGLETVTFEEGTTRVLSNLFKEVQNLKNVTLLDTMTEIGNSAFSSCTSLKEVSIPDSVTDMGTYIFDGCISLEKVKLPSIRQNITEGTFRNCSRLTDIVLPNTVTAIRYKAFQGCESLEEIKLPENLQIIEDAAFENCSKLKSVNIPDAITSFGSWVFKNCDTLTNVSLNISSGIGQQTFYDCDELTSLTLGDGVTSIGTELCYSCDKLSEVKFGKYITNIPDSSFRLCSSLTSVTLPRFCKTVSANAFAEDTKLTSAYVPNTVTKIENNSFSYPAKMTMYGKSGSYAEEYANSRNMTFNGTAAPITKLDYADNFIDIGRRNKIRPTLNIEPAFDTSVITFASSDENICTVSDTGEIYGKNYGTATITISSDSGAKDTITVNVVRLADSVSLDKTELDLETGDTAKLKATLSPSDATDKITWKSSNDSVATVDNGAVTAVGAGTAVITVTTTGGKTASCTVKVTGTFTVTATAGENGRISPSGEVPVKSDAKTTFNILPDYGYVVKDVLVNGASVGAVESYTFSNLTDNATITAEFAKVNVAYENNAITISSEAALKDLKLIIATYDEGKLTDCEIKTVTANAGENYQEPVTEADNMKLMLWNGLDTMRPIWCSK